MEFKKRSYDSSSPNEPLPKRLKSNWGETLRGIDQTSRSASEEDKKWLKYIEHMEATTTVEQLFDVLARIPWDANAVVVRYSSPLLETLGDIGLDLVKTRQLGAWNIYGGPQNSPIHITLWEKTRALKYVITSGNLEALNFLEERGLCLSDWGSMMVQHALEGVSDAMMVKVMDSMKDTTQIWRFWTESKVYPVVKLRTLVPLQTYLIQLEQKIPEVARNVKKMLHSFTYTYVRLEFTPNAFDMKALWEVGLQPWQLIKDEDIQQILALESAEIPFQSWGVECANRLLTQDCSEDSVKVMKELIRMGLDFTQTKPLTDTWKEMLSK